MNDSPIRKDTLLIVDDMPDNVAVLFTFLTNTGFSVIIAQDGEDALQTVKLAHPDLILLDIMMPRMDGFEVCRRLKAQPDTRAIPIIFMTALAETVDKVKGFQLGAADYITKPLQQEEVLARVTAHLRIYKLQQQLEKQNQQLKEEMVIRENVEASLQRTAGLLANRTIELQDRSEALQKRTEELEKRNAELDSFSRMVAHDLKSPIAGMLGLLRVLQEQCELGIVITKKPIVWIDQLTQLTQKVLSIIDALLLLAGISRATKFEIRPLNGMSILINQVIKQRLVEPLKHCSGEVVVPDHFPLAQGYAPWVEEVWFNYLSNGLKYGGKPPRLEVGADEIPSSSSVAPEGKSDGGNEDGFIRFWVRDNGAGLTPELQARLFIPFTRLHRGVEGHGLGLSIVRQIVEKLGGTVGVETEIGQGSTFYFTLPAYRDHRKVWEELK